MSMGTASPGVRPDGFRWQDGERLVCFGPGVLDDVGELLGQGYTLLSTERSRASAPTVAARAGLILTVGPGRVDGVAAGLREQVQGELLVALGGGRVIDTAKALAAADPPRRVAAIPTTLSGAEMTRVHRHLAGIPPDTPHVRPAVVICDPALAASQAEPDLAASAANALAHAVEGPLTPLASPVPTLVAHEGARLLRVAMAGAGVDRDRLALAALLCGYAIDSSGYGLHHVLAQTLVRETGVGHGPANAALLPHTLNALLMRFPEELDALQAAMGFDPRLLAIELADRAQARRLRDHGVERERLARLADAAAQRPELGLTPPAADSTELLGIYEAAW